MTVTLNDVAKKAGVSPKTVSHVVNGEKDVSEEIRLQTLQVIERKLLLFFFVISVIANGNDNKVIVA